MELGELLAGVWPIVDRVVVIFGGFLVFKQLSKMRLVQRRMKWEDLLWALSVIDEAIVVGADPVVSVMLGPEIPENPEERVQRGAEQKKLDRELDIVGWAVKDGYVDGNLLVLVRKAELRSAKMKLSSLSFVREGTRELLSLVKV